MCANYDRFTLVIIEAAERRLCWVMSAVRLDDQADVQPVNRAVQVYHTLYQRHIYVLAFAGRALVYECRGNCGIRIHACEKVREGDTVLKRTPALFTGHAYHAAYGLPHQVIARLLRVRSGLTKCAY